MRKLFYFLIAMVSAVIANAQDPSTWTEGQDVTDQIMLGEHDGTCPERCEEVQQVNRLIYSHKQGKRRRKLPLSFCFGTFET